jgi:hypothetical protein
MIVPPIMVIASLVGFCAALCLLLDPHAHDFSAEIDSLMLAITVGVAWCGACGLVTLLVFTVWCKPVHSKRALFAFRAQPQALAPSQTSEQKETVTMTGEQKVEKAARVAPISQLDCWGLPPDATDLAAARAREVTTSESHTR